MSRAAEREHEILELLSFLHQIDDHLASIAGEGETLDLFLLGRSALVPGFGLSLMTKDIDVFQVHGSRLLDEALRAFGRDSDAIARFGFFLEDVSSGLPPMPMGYQQRSILIEGDWQVVRPHRPEIHDLVATKLSRFHAKDREDVQILADTGDLTVAGLRHSLDLAFAFAADEDEDPKRRRAYESLRRVENYLEGRSSGI